MSKRKPYGHKAMSSDPTKVKKNVYVSPDLFRQYRAYGGSIDSFSINAEDYLKRMIPQLERANKLKEK